LELSRLLMMSQANMEIVRKTFEAFRVGGIEAGER
jgi:hypothetical protein